MKALIILSNGMEEIEALYTRDLLLRSIIEVTTLTFEESEYVISQNNLVIKADTQYRNIQPLSYDVLIIPGGSYVNKVINQDTNITNLIKLFNNANKLIACICAAPMFLGKLNLLENKEFVCYPGVSSNIKGIYRPSLKAVTSLNLITSKSVGTILDFVEHIITYLESKSVFTQLKKNICV